MALSKQIHRYNDIASHLQTILDKGTLRREFASPAAALRWRQRAYMYRSLLGEREGGSRYDHLMFRITKAEPNVVTILTEPEDDGWFVDAAGNRVDPGLSFEDQKNIDEMRELQRIRERAGFVYAERPSPNHADVSDPSGVDTTDPFGWNHKGASDE